MISALSNSETLHLVDHQVQKKERSVGGKASLSCKVKGCVYECGGSGADEAVKAE